MPIFMIGTQRSGSNLLRLMLNQLPEVAAPHPPHILQRLMPLVPQYGDLRNDAALALLADDVCRLVELNPVAWEGASLKTEDLIRRARARSLTALFGAAYDCLAEAWGKSTWCCKSLANIHYLNDIEACFGAEARYIYLYRDGRDVALSFRKAIVGEKHPYHIGREWAATQEVALAARERIGPSRFISVRYEDLVARPEATIRALCQFLGYPFHVSMLDFHATDEARKAAESSALWGNVVNPVMAGNTRKYLKEMPTEDIHVFERVAGDVLTALGYERSASPTGTDNAFTAEEIRQFDADNARFKKEMLDRTDPEDIKRRDRQAGYIQEIKQRQSGGGAWINL